MPTGIYQRKPRPARPIEWLKECVRCESIKTLDHDHTCCPKNKSCGACVRGVLCWHCNAALGMLRDEAWRVDALGNYMLRWGS